MKTLDHADVARDFLKLLEEVDRGETVIITENGKPIAKMVPAAEGDALSAQAEAKRALLEHLARREPWTAPKWTREDLYADEPEAESGR